ncbi:hypothetical protein GCK72_021232 [Caenorhabditis remanei]|uniref:F-box domain-containing protein n=1 Tax=Caenorhabditis remanei TaxID=31234 RepID=A0A6A5GK17_CAERE|nr:hypothetical protein GCK72_021232 [Caenorhabditis remanei]KAF1754669.1 hypothetical protein GCK72_021232 [Caenorhabditis remanei]
MTTEFPLLRLPYLVLMPVLEQMEFMERIALSLLSKRSRMFLKLIEMKSKYINLILMDNRIEMGVCCDNNQEWRLLHYIDEYPQRNFVYRDEILISWCPGSPLKVDYVISIMDVMHCKSINQFIVEDISEHDSIPIVAKLPKIDEVVVEYDLCSNVLSDEALLQKERILLKILKSVLPVSSAVTVSYRFQNRNHLLEILKGNFDAVILKHFDKLITLNDLCITNTKVLELHKVTLEIRDLNRYFKLWTKKICNDRLEYLEVRTYSNTSMDLLLDGLNAVPVPIETKREFRVLGNVKEMRWDEEITAEFDIKRADGRTATIRFGKSDVDNYIHFYVWPESTNHTINLEPNQFSLSLFSTICNSCVELFERTFL